MTMAANSVSRGKLNRSAGHQEKKWVGSSQAMVFHPLSVPVKAAGARRSITSLRSGGIACFSSQEGVCGSDGDRCSMQNNAACRP